MLLLNKFEDFIKQKKLFARNDKILLAVSGGIDSVVMVHLFAEAKFNFGIVHCNFQLRGKESDKDEVFVRALAKKCKVPFFVERFETKKFAEENKLSIQMAARELRYKFFESVLKKNNFNFLATAHHAGDSTETVLLNLVRGSGIAAYHGIKIKNKKIIRPLLFASRKEIETYAKKKKLKWREDASNNSDDYLRNKIRHQVIPALKEINPSLDETVLAHAQQMQDVELIYNSFIQNVKEKILHQKKEKIKFSISELLSYPSSKTILYEVIKDYGFSRHHANDLHNALNETEVKFFYSEKFEIIKERYEVFIRARYYCITYCLDIEGCGEFATSHFSFSLSEKKITEKLKKEIFSKRDKATEYFDADKISFPLLLINGMHEIYFYPLGMKGKKLLSDFYTDAKYSYSDKEKQLLLLTKNDVLWVVGKRMDDRFKITAQTKKILKITFDDKR